MDSDLAALDSIQQYLLGDFEPTTMKFSQSPSFGDKVFLPESWVYSVPSNNEVVPVKVEPLEAASKEKVVVAAAERETHAPHFRGQVVEPVRVTHKRRSTELPSPSSDDGGSKNKRSIISWRVLAQRVKLISQY
ncbi:hypothetical protein CFP56_031516 [Quercus suber]|uniref:Uncharacterized protein n=1 Tax=Quercus suber TaxID=58331 RepID=A0AAW0LT92_QUESU